MKCMASLIIVVLTFSSSPLLAETATGMIKIKSPYSVTITLDRLQSILNKKGMTIFKRISHSDGAAKANLELRDTEILIFGNPKVGTPLMLCQQTVALDLPQKALAYKDKNNQVWLAYNDPAYIAERHQVIGCEVTIAKISKALANLTNAAVKIN